MVELKTKTTKNYFRLTYIF